MGSSFGCAGFWSGSKWSRRSLVNDWAGRDSSLCWYEMGQGATRRTSTDRGSARSSSRMSCAGDGIGRERERGTCGVVRWRLLGREGPANGASMYSGGPCSSASSTVPALGLTVLRGLRKISTTGMRSPFARWAFAERPLVSSRAVAGAEGREDVLLASDTERGWGATWGS